MLKYILSLSWVISSFFSYSQQVHTISIIQKRQAVDKDKETIKEMRNSIIRFIDGKPGKEYTVDNPSDKNTETIINDFYKNVLKEDVVLFYFSGTGKYIKGELNMEIGGEFKPVSIIIDLVKGKSPKTGIILVDCALREIEKDNKGKDENHSSIITKEMTKKLFLLKKESQIICIKAASPPKQPIHRSAILGSFFLQSFKNNMYDEMGLEEDMEPSWDNIIKKTEQDVTSITRNGQIPAGTYEKYH
jgi:hypothetical protein